MCLDIDHHYNNQKIKVNQNYTGNLTMMETDSPASELKLNIKSLCGGSLIDDKPIFDANGEIIYVIRNDKIRAYSVETGELITELADNKNGTIVGLFLDPNTKKSLISCTVNGEISFWKLDSNLITLRKKLDIKMLAIVKRFLVTLIDDILHAVVHYIDTDKTSSIVLMDMTKNEVVHQFNLPGLDKISEAKVKFAAGNGFIALIHKLDLFVIDKKSFEFKHHKNSFFPINVVECHPSDDIIATGDIKGKIILWSNIFSKNAVKNELHWHHQIVLSIAFSQSGTVLYSGGTECVLVKWQIKEKSQEKNFLPRVSGSIKQISVDPAHDKLTISLDDNAIQIINSNLNQLKTIQDFTQISAYDLGLNQPFPAKITVNPKNQHLVLNGRIGHLQFFSTKTMRLLFNIDITMQNAIPRQKNCNHFSTEVTHVAFSSCGKWMATIECWNDRMSSIESRLKFWSFMEQKQTYALHTQIEQPHDKNIISVSFSNIDDSYICATAGLDRAIKIWSLEASEEIKNPKMIWMLIEQLSYKNLPIRCLTFSQDSSLLSAGFGNVLCVWDAIDFKLKCALSAPSILDGSTNRVLISLSSKSKGSKTKNTLSSLAEKRQKTLQMMNAIINDPASNQSLVKNMTEEKSRIFKRKSLEGVKPKNLKHNEKKLIFQAVMSTANLNFNEKLQVLHKLNIYYNISSRIENDVIDFISKNISEDQHLYKSLRSSINEVKSHSKFKLLWRYNTWKNLDVKRNRKIITVRKLLKSPIKEDAIKHKSSQSENTFLPVKNTNHINSIHFCTDELSHLVIISTSNRILVWNLLTLKIQGSFKIQCKHIALDPLTNLVAIFTKFNELFVIHPSPPMTIFHQKNIPKICSAIWVPQENPRRQSLSVNWQAASQLLFLTEDQEICCLSSPNDEEIIDLTPFMSDINEYSTTTPLAAMLTRKDTRNQARDISIKHIITNGSGNVKELINLSNHGMPPMSKLCNEFVASLLTSQRKTVEKSEAIQFLDTTAIEFSDEEMEVTEIDETAAKRKAYEESEKKIKEHIAKKKEADLNIENELKNMKLDEIVDFCITKN